MENSPVLMFKSAKKLEAEKHHLKCYINFHHTHIIQKHFSIIMVFSTCLMGNKEMPCSVGKRLLFIFLNHVSFLRNLYIFSSVYKSRSSHTSDSSADPREDSLKASDANWASAERKGKNYILYLKHLGELRLVKTHTQKKNKKTPRPLLVFWNVKSIYYDKT